MAIAQRLAFSFFLKIKQTRIYRHETTYFYFNRYRNGIDRCKGRYFYSD